MSTRASMLRLFVVVPSACFDQETFTRTFQATVIGVSDGDTMRVRLTATKRT